MARHCFDNNGGYIYWIWEQVIASYLISVNISRVISLYWNTILNQLCDKIKLETFLYNILNDAIMPKTVVLSLGGSLIVPNGVDIAFLKNFKKVIEKFIKKDYRFVIYCGGGKLARNMQDAASKIANLSNKDLDWIGIYATKLNAKLVRTIFKNNSEHFVVDDPNKKIIFKKSVLIAAGWLPGWSTDYDAVLLAKNLGIKEIINMSNVDYVYDKDPRIYKDAKKIEKMNWQSFGKLVDGKWKAGMNAPFDPVAAKEAKKLGMKIYIIGKNIKNLGNILNGKKFRGTIIG